MELDKSNPDRWRHVGILFNESRSKCRRHARRGCKVLLVQIAIGLAACGGAPAKPALMAKSNDVIVTVSQLRALDYDFASRFTASVTGCADEIIAASEDAVVRRRALLWKMNAVPAARSAAFHHDPLVALYDLWALALQQRDFFTDGHGTKIFETSQHCARRVSQQLVDDVRNIARGVTRSGDISEIERRLETWADQNPIEDGLLIRRSASADISALTPQMPHKGLQAVESLEETTRDLADRITILSADLPTESRLQAEYLVHGLFEDYLEAPTTQVLATLDRVNTLLDEVEPFLGVERDSPFAMLLEALEDERNAWIDALGHAGGTFQDSVASERTALQQSIREEVAWGLAEFRSTGQTLIDHAFVRAIQLALILLVIALVATFVVRRWAYRPNHRSEDQADT